MTNTHKFKNVSLKRNIYEDVKRLSADLSSNKKLSNAKVIGLGIELLKTQVSSSLTKTITNEDYKGSKIKP